MKNNRDEDTLFSFFRDGSTDTSSGVYRRKVNQWVLFKYGYYREIQDEDGNSAPGEYWAGSIEGSTTGSTAGGTSGGLISYNYTTSGGTGSGGEYTIIANAIPVQTTAKSYGFISASLSNNGIGVAYQYAYAINTGDMSGIKGRPSGNKEDTTGTFDIKKRG